MEPTLPIRGTFKSHYREKKEGVIQLKIEQIATKVVRNIKKELSVGNVPWQKPWQESFIDMNGNLVNPNDQYNATYGTKYQGGNLLVLASLGYKSKLWGTFKNISDLGGKIKRGEQSMTVWKWKIEEKPKVSIDEEENEVPVLDAEGNQVINKFWRCYTSEVFNLDQTTGVKVKPSVKQKVNFGAKSRKKIGRNVASARIADGYINNGGPKFSHNGGNQAFYRVSRDSVHLPLKELFNSINEYYSTKFHELGHSTGHPTRLARGFEKTPIFGSKVYAKEELVAELTAAILCSMTGINNTIKNSGAYCKGWLKALNNDPKMFMDASKDATKAVKFIVEAAERRSAALAA